MAENVPTIAYWMGRPLNEIPRDELEREFCAAHAEIDRMRRKMCDNSVAYIHDLASMRLRHIEDSKGIIGRVLDKLTA